MGLGLINISDYDVRDTRSRAQTITVADESLTPRLLGLQAHTVNADTEGNEKIT